MDAPCTAALIDATAPDCITCENSGEVVVEANTRYGSRLAPCPDCPRAWDSGAYDPAEQHDRNED